LKRVLSEDNFVKIFNRKRVEELDRRFQIASSRNSVNSVRDIIKSKNLMREDISKEVEFLLNLSGKSDRDEVVELNSNGKLSDLSKRIIDIVDGNQRTLLNAPTGTGKSYLVKNIFPVKYEKYDYNLGL